MNAFNYKDNLIPNITFGDRMSDIFFGTTNAQNKQNLAYLNYQNQFNEYAQDKQNAFNKQSQADQNAFNEKMWNKAMQYNTEMSNTAYQRKVNDMQKAGINPMVAFAGGAGAGASTPTTNGISSAGLTSAGLSSGHSTPPALGGGIFYNFIGDVVGSVFDAVNPKKLKQDVKDLIRIIF